MGWLRFVDGLFLCVGFLRVGSGLVRGRDMGVLLLGRSDRVGGDVVWLVLKASVNFVCPFFAGGKF